MHTVQSSVVSTDRSTFLRSDPPADAEIADLREHIRKTLAEAEVPELDEDDRLVGTGGTIRNLAKIDRTTGQYPIPRIHGYILGRKRVGEIAGRVGSRAGARRRLIRGLNADRADSIVGGALATLVTMEALGADELIVSGQGLREGVFYDLLGMGLPPVDQVRRVSVAALASRFASWDEGRARRRTAIAVTFLHDGATEIAAGFPVKLVVPCEGTGYEVGSMSIVKGAKNLENAKKFYEFALTPAAQKIGGDLKNFQTHILPALGNRRLDEVNHDRMEEFVSDLVKKVPRIRKKKTDSMEDGEAAPNTTDQAKTRTLAKATIQTVIKQLCKFFNHARKRKHITENPASGLSQLYSQAPAKHDVIEPLTHEEVPLFLAAVETRKDSRQHYALFFTAIHTGLREGELAGLQTGDIDFNGKYLVVSRSIDRVHRKVVPTKTKRIRPPPSSVGSILRQSARPASRDNVAIHARKDRRAHRTGTNRHNRLRHAVHLRGHVQRNRRGVGGHQVRLAATGELVDQPVGDRFALRQQLELVDGVERFADRARAPPVLRLSMGADLYPRYRRSLLPSSAW